MQVRSGHGRAFLKGGEQGRLSDVVPFMEHRGVQYQVVQTANPTGWRWTIFVPGRQPKTGTAGNRSMAIRLAEIAIDKAIRVKSAKAPVMQ
jgi:hypothetical protein